jgi:hypothetical protein
MFCWQFGGQRQLEAYFSPMSGAEPIFEPERWNNSANIRKTHNCYAYVLDIVNPKFRKKPQPGYASGYDGLSDSDIRSCDKLMERMMADNPSVNKITFKDKCPRGYRKAFLAVDDQTDPDYHFYRLDNSGYWSHKPGATSATMLDGKKQMIRNPKQADRNFAMIRSKVALVIIAVKISRRRTSEEEKSCVRKGGRGRFVKNESRSG